MPRRIEPGHLSEGSDLAAGHKLCLFLGEERTSCSETLLKKVQTCPDGIEHDANRSCVIFPNTQGRQSVQQLRIGKPATMNCCHTHIRSVSPAYSIELN